MQRMTQAGNCLIALRRRATESGRSVLYEYDRNAAAELRCLWAVDERDDGVDEVVVDLVVDVDVDGSRRLAVPRGEPSTRKVVTSRYTEGLPLVDAKCRGELLEFLRRFEAPTDFETARSASHLRFKLSATSANNSPGRDGVC